MKLLGDWNWYLPSWLEWLPRLQPGPSAEMPADPFAEDESRRASRAPALRSEPGTPTPAGPSFALGGFVALCMENG